jgi:uncharacterized coiled-coil DUF342 family protein
MNEYLFAVIAAAPGLLLGWAAMKKASNTDCTERMNRQREELDTAKADIVELRRRVDDCDRERHQLLRENLELYRRVDAKSG